MPKNRAVSGSWILLLAFAFVPQESSASSAEKVLYSFNVDRGMYPGAGLTIGEAGNFLGTTGNGGGISCTGGGGPGCGVIFQIDKHGKESVLHAFAGGDDDGANPDSGLITDGAGNYYGVTAAGGPNSDGVVYELAADGTESMIYAFQGGADGRAPMGNLARDGQGNLYGTTFYGGNPACLPPSGCGTVFEVSPGGVLTVLHTFQGGTDGAYSLSGLIIDSGGNLYGTTLAGGGNGCVSIGGCGTAFRIAPDGTETILHAFPANASDGESPGGGLIMDGAGNLFGTTGEGGQPRCEGNSAGCGTVFEISPDGTESVLYAFKGGSDGESPGSAVVMDSSGNLYGGAGGGGVGCKRNGGCGTVFKLAPNGKESVLYAFDGRDGSVPQAQLLLVGKKLYGTTLQGGSHKKGVVYEIEK